MIIYPTIEMQNGRPVSLFRGRMEEPQIWHVDPIKKAKEFSSAGATWLHMTDFDAITEEDTDNSAVIKQIIKESGMSVQVGGGIRTMAKIEEWIGQGAARVVIGTAATVNPDLVKEAAKYFPDQVVLAVDVFEGQVMAQGWKEKTAFTPEEFIGWFEADPLAAIIVSDIDADLDMAEDSLALTTRLAQVSNKPVISRGICRTLDDLSRLKYVPQVSGTIISRSLFDRTIEIADALEMAAETSEPTADFI